jgi:hypothetical protein
MKRLLTATLVVLAVACSKEAKTSTPPAANEKTYPMTATLVSRDPAKNTVNLDNKEVPGGMAAMKMDYELRGAKVASLPPDGTPVEVTVHDMDGSYYVTDVKTKK